jgi:hypothetical protein
MYPRNLTVRLSVSHLLVVQALKGRKVGDDLLDQHVDLGAGEHVVDEDAVAVRQQAHLQATLERPLRSSSLTESLTALRTLLRGGQIGTRCPILRCQIGQTASH